MAGKIKTWLAGHAGDVAFRNPFQKDKLGTVVLLARCQDPGIRNPDSGVTFPDWSPISTPERP